MHTAQFEQAMARMAQTVAQFGQAFQQAMGQNQQGLTALPQRAPQAGQAFGGSASAAFAPMIPLMAEGGVVRAPTLVMAGEQGAEAVVPLERYQAMTQGLRSTPAGETNVHLIVVDSREKANAAARPAAPPPGPGAFARLAGAATAPSQKTVTHGTLAHRRLRASPTEKGDAPPLYDQPRAAGHLLLPESRVWR